MNLLPRAAYPSFGPTPPDHGPAAHPARSSAARHGIMYFQRSPMRGKDVVTVVKETAADWKEDNASRLAAALAYYTLLSLAPLIVLTVVVVGLVLGNDDAARASITSQI